MKFKAWVLAVVLAVGSAVPVGAGVFYSPVFNMPLQPAPSPYNGGFYWVTANRGIYGPNYYVAPPFNPVSGFNGTFVGQSVFAKLHEEYTFGGGKKDGGGPGSGGHGANAAAGNQGTKPAKQIGIGGYTMDYSDPETSQKFDATAPMVNGYTPFAPNGQAPPPNYGNGPMPMPRYSNYPNFQPGPSQPPMNGYRPYYGMSAPMPQGAVYQAGYYGWPQNYNSYWQNPVMQVQAQFPPAMPYPQVQPSFGNSYNQGYGNMPGQPTMPGYPIRMPNNSMPYYPTPSPSYGMPPTNFPVLPNPSYEPPPCPNNCNQNCQNPLVRSPRDFFMWSEAQEDKAARARHPLTVP